MKNAILNRAAWIAGISSLALLTACGGGGSGTTPLTGAEALSVPNTAIWGGQSAVNSITISRKDGQPVQANTLVRISGWTCTSEDPQGLNQPQATDEVASELVQAPAVSVEFPEVRVPAANLLVTVLNGNSIYYAKRHDMATAGNSNGDLGIVLDLAADSEEAMAAQFDNCP